MHIPSAVAVPVRTVKHRAGWAYYVVTPLLIAAVFYYCSTRAHRKPAPVPPAAATAPAQIQPTSAPAAEPAVQESDFETDTEEPQEQTQENQIETQEQ